VAVVLLPQQRPPRRTSLLAPARCQPPEAGRSTWSISKISQVSPDPEDRPQGYSELKPLTARRPAPWRSLYDVPRLGRPAGNGRRTHSAARQSGDLHAPGDLVRPKSISASVYSSNGAWPTLDPGAANVWFSSPGQRGRCPTPPLTRLVGRG
jgi:hypothetical protein